jgi:hypothetical protein
MHQPEVIEKLVSFEEDHADQKLLIRHEQHIPDEYISTLRRDKVDTLHTPKGEFYRIATVPTAIVDLWLSEGFDIHKESIQATLARLRKHDMDAFIVGHL